MAEKEYICRFTISPTRVINTFTALLTVAKAFGMGATVRRLLFSSSRQVGDSRTKTPSKGGRNLECESGALFLTHRFLGFLMGLVKELPAYGDVLEAEQS